MLSESTKKDYNRYFDALSNISYDILIFFRCELTTRAFSYMKDMTVSV